MCLNTSSPAEGTVGGDYAAFRRWGLAREGRLPGVEFEALCFLNCKNVNRLPPIPTVPPKLLSRCGQTVAPTVS